LSWSASGHVKVPIIEMRGVERNHKG